MALITIIDGVPLYTTVPEAEVWGSASGLSGYHIHTFQGQTGYMGGTTHILARSVPPVTNTNTNTNSPPTPPMQPPTYSGGGNSGGY
tara:strand:- start:133 stop:393 length:261 start_codon:yes stop_codon:yes gene_type:complete